MLYRKKERNQVETAGESGTEGRNYPDRMHVETKELSESGLLAIAMPNDLFMDVDMVAAVKRAKELGRPLTEDERAEFEKRGKKQESSVR